MRRNEVIKGGMRRNEKECTRRNEGTFCRGEEKEPQVVKIMRDTI